MVVLDALNTFDQDPDSIRHQYEVFENQIALDNHLRMFVTKTKT